MTAFFFPPFRSYAIKTPGKMSEEEFITLFYKQLLDKGNKSQINGGGNKGVTDVFIVEGEAILSVKLRLTK